MTDPRRERDTPTKPLSRIESEDIVPFLEERDPPRTLPPPPARLAKRQEQVLSHVRKRSTSSSDLAADLIAENREWMEEVMERRLLQNELAFRKEQVAKAEAENEETRKFWRGVAATVIGGGILAALCWTVAELIRHAGP